MWSRIVLVAAFLGHAHCINMNNQCVRAVGGDYFRKEILLEEFGLLDEVTADWKNNKIYFYKFVPYSPYQFFSWDIDSRRYSNISELHAYCSLTVDQSNGRVYAGCRKSGNHGGLYTYDSNAQRFVRVTNQTDSVVWAHFADKLYYLTEAGHQLHAYAQSHSRPVVELQDEELLGVVLDGHKNWVYEHTGNLYVQKVGTDHAVELDSEDLIMGLSVDPQGNVYAHGNLPPSIYHIDTINNKVRRVLDTGETCLSLTFDKDSNFVCILFSGYGTPVPLVRWVRCQ